MRSIRLRSIALPISAVALALGAVACDPATSDDSGTSGGTSGGDNGGSVVVPDEPKELRVSASGTSCFAAQNGTVTVTVRDIPAGGGYHIEALYPQGKGGVIKGFTHDGTADNSGTAIWSFTCGKLPGDPNYRIEARDISQGLKGDTTFDVLRTK